MSLPQTPLRVISSMATRQLLAKLALAWPQPPGLRPEVESVGGVDAARRVQAAEAFDVVVLASDAIDRLMQSGAVRAGSRVDVALSTMALAVQSGAPLPDIGTEAALKNAVLGARSLAYSTGPSGAHLLRLFDAWGITEQVKARTVQAPPGVPVGSLVASGQVRIGFQQLSELQGLPGIVVLPALPGAAHFVTTFAGAVCATSLFPREAAAMLAFFAGPDAAPVVRQHGMQPATHPGQHP